MKFMSNFLSKENNGATPDTSESVNTPNNPLQPQRNANPNEGDYRNVNNNENKKEEFDDEYEIELENDLNEEQVRPKRNK